MTRNERRGFAGMEEQKQRQIASMGGRAAHARGTAHEFTPEEASAAGRKGGQIVSRNRQHMAEIGRKGGRAAHQREPAIPVNGTRSQDFDAANGEAAFTAAQAWNEQERSNGEGSEMREAIEV